MVPPRNRTCLLVTDRVNPRCVACKADGTPCACLLKRKSSDRSLYIGAFWCGGTLKCSGLRGTNPRKRLGRSLPEHSAKPTELKQTSTIARMAAGCELKLY